MMLGPALQNLYIATNIRVEILVPHGLGSLLVPDGLLGPLGPLRLLPGRLLGPDRDVVGRLLLLRVGDGAARVGPGEGLAGLPVVAVVEVVVDGPVGGPVTVLGSGGVGCEREDRFVRF